jgi:DNA-binding LacI/PurR family transcriptional regulator
MTAEPEHDRVGRQRPVTIAQIAERAGVSIPTVSKVINGRADVAAQTRARIEAAIREHGYRRPEKNLDPARLVEVIFHEIEGAYATELLRGVERVARDHDFGVVVSELEGRHTPGRGWIESAVARRPTGIICVFSGPSAEQRAQLNARGIPFVLLDPTGEPGQDIPSVGATNWSGGLSATRHLLDLGHRRIAMITGPSRVLSSRARLDGYRAAMDAAGVPVDPALVCQGDFHVAEGLEYGRELLALPDPPTAVFAANDLQALGVYQAAWYAGLRIPEHLSVVGFDDLPVAQWIGPQLTTVRQPLTEMAATATTMLIRLAQDDPPPNVRLELSTTLIVRESTAAPRG